MYSEAGPEITKDLLHKLLRDFAREYKRLFKDTPCEITIVGGSSIVINYGFRDSTRDINYFSSPQRSLKDAIYAVANKNGLDADWMNDDFRFSASFTSKLSEISAYYCSYNNDTLVIRTVRSKYLIAMKMKSGREFGNDVSDIIGIIMSEKQNGNDVSFDEIMKAGIQLYGDDFVIPDSLKARVSEFCLISEEELVKNYQDSVARSNEIKDEIEVVIETERISLNRISAKVLGEKIEEMKRKNKNS